MLICHSTRYEAIRNAIVIGEYKIVFYPLSLQEGIEKLKASHKHIEAEKKKVESVLKSAEKQKKVMEAHKNPSNMMTTKHHIALTSTLSGKKTGEKCNADYMSVSKYDGINQCLANGYILFCHLAPLSLDKSSGQHPVEKPSSQSNLADQLSKGYSRPSKITKIKNWIHTKVSKICYKLFCIKV